jgi:diaminohydroxyphosphoribosylaminopyrimidine deaminase/5-amino-6-(5-phosphoribosylamino)uracil reductase
MLSRRGIFGTFFVAMTDADYMMMALELAERGHGRTSPNPMVGAVLVRDGGVVGRGYHARAGEDHAEVVALKDAGEQARGATLYINLEPCCHHGRTPPCVDAIVEAGVKRAVVAMADPSDKVNGKGIAELRQGGGDV